MSCICQECGNRFKMDLVIKNILWEKIKPKGKPHGAGLLCPQCIVSKIEDLEEYCVYKLIKI